MSCANSIVAAASVCSLAANTSKQKRVFLDCVLACALCAHELAPVRAEFQLGTLNLHKNHSQLELVITARARRCSASASVLKIEPEAQSELQADANEFTAHDASRDVSLCDCDCASHWLSGPSACDTRHALAVKSDHYFSAVPTLRSALLIN